MKPVVFAAVDIADDEEPRVHRRFWPAAKRARSTAARIVAVMTATLPDPFLLSVPPGLRFNFTSSGVFRVGHAGGVVTALESAIVVGAVQECARSR